MYNYQNYQQSPGYQHEPSQPPPQYQPPPQVASNQANDYISYPAQSYSTQGNNYGGGQDNSLASSHYGGNGESTNRAAEVLRNMSNTSYSPNTTAAASQPGFTGTNATTAPAAAASARYLNASPVHSQQQTHSSHTSYGQSQARPHSVNSTRNQGSTSDRGLPPPGRNPGFPTQRAQMIYQEQQRPASPARNAATAPVTQYNEYSHRRVPSAETSRKSHSTAIPTSYGAVDTHIIPPITQSPAAPNITEQYNQGTITVDPMAVYDPWPDYQRQQEKMRAQRAVEDAARAEEEWKAKAVREEEERKAKEEELKKAASERARQAAVGKSRTPSGRMPSTQDDLEDINSASSVQQSESGLEAEIRAMMSKMRELNNKDPKLLARIWEEERRAKAPNSPTTQPKPSTRPATAQPGPSSTAAVANQRKKAMPKENQSTNTTTKSHAHAPPPSLAAVTPQAQAVTTGVSHPSGNTLWPPEKKDQLAAAATAYLNGQNQTKTITPERILDMLEKNPSYIELCEYLEAMDLTLDRAKFAKELLAAVPDINSGSRSQVRGQKGVAGITAIQMNGTGVQRAPVPPAIMTKKDTIVSYVAPGAHHTSTAIPSSSRASFSAFPNNGDAQSPVLVAEMIPIKPELKPPANKEEAARKRNFDDIIDLTAADEDDDMGPLPKRPNVGSAYTSHSAVPSFDVPMDTRESNPPAIDLSAASRGPLHSPQNVVPSPSMSVPLSSEDSKLQAAVQPLNKKKALRRNGYNIKTIARDVLLACGRHPEERQLNAHLDILKTSFGSNISNDSDLSTLRWDLIDPGRPPKGFYRDTMQSVADDADDEDGSDDDDVGGRNPPPRPMSYAIGGGGTANATTQALPLTPLTNPFKQNRRGRQPRHSYLGGVPAQTAQSPATAAMSASDPRSNPASTGVGYAAFRQYDAEGNLVPKKRGRPVGWRKAIHGSAAAQSSPSANGHTGPRSAKPSQFGPYQPSQLGHVRSAQQEPIMVDSRSPSVSERRVNYQSFKCKWRNCKADLHNLETLKKHVHKLHQNATAHSTFECLWDNCGREITHIDPTTSRTIESYTPFAFADDSKWRNHLELRHFGPLSWELGDGPASGLSDAHDSEAYLSDAHGRQVTPRVVAAPSPHREARSIGMTSFTNTAPGRGRGRVPKVSHEQEAHDIQARLVAQKKRLGGPGIDRGGATLVNEKRRKGFSDDDQTEEEFVDAEE